MAGWRDAHLVAQKVAGEDMEGLRPRDLAEPWRTIFERVEAVRHRDLAERAVWKATEGLEGRNELVEAVVRWLPDARGFGRWPSLGKLGEELAPVRWLWPGWIPRGMLSLLGAAPGAGKSLLALDLARRVIDGEVFPGNGEGRFRPGNVVYVDGEAVPQILNERALAWGMDRERVFLMLPADRYGMLDLGAGEEQDRLVDMVYDLEPELVVVDSLGSVSLRGENNVEDVRELLGFLAAVAREFGVGLLLIHHLRKRGGALGSVRTSGLVSPDDFRGSSHIMAMARSVMGLSVVQEGPEVDRNGPRRLEVIKTNLCRHPAALGVVLDSGEGDGAVWVRYAEAPRGWREPTLAEECAEWLVDLLEEAGEGMRPKDVVRVAEEYGFTRATVYRARQALGAVIVEVGKGVRDPKKLWAVEDLEDE